MTQSAAAPDLLARFEQDGYSILRGVLPRAVAETVKAELHSLVNERAGTLVALGKIKSDLAAEPFETRLARLYANCMDLAPMSFRGDLLHRPGYFDLFFNHALLDVVETILGPELRIYPNYTVRPKFPDDPKTLVLWHQDAAYTEQIKTDDGVENLRMVNVWSPLVPATVENGCMQFIPGTHKLGVVPHLQKDYYLEIPPQFLQPHLPRAVNIELNPGDIVLFSNLLFHVGLPNRSNHIRWSIDWRYQDARQPTLRPSQGYIARSRSNPAAAIRDAMQWAGVKAGFV